LLATRNQLVIDIALGNIIAHGGNYGFVAQYIFIIVVCMKVEVYTDVGFGISQYLISIWVVLKAGTEQEWNGTGGAPRVKIVFEEFTSFPVK